MRVLAIDVGSSAVKAAWWNGRRFAAQARVAFRTEYDGVRVEAPADGILHAVERAGREVLRSAGTVDVVSFCTFSCGVVVTDNKGRVRAGAITHQDRRSVVEAEELVRRLGKKWLLDHTGNLPYPGSIGSSTAAWLRRHAASAFRGDYRLGQLSSLVALMLTGRWSIDPSQATFLGLWDIREGTWNLRLCKAVGITPDSLPQLAYADSIIGRITPQIATRWGLREGTPVVGGFIDTDAAVIQTPMRPGQLAHNTGSTDVLAMCLKTPRPIEGILTRPLGVGGNFQRRWLAVRTISAAGSAIAWARDTLFPDLSDAAWQRTLKRISTARETSPLTCIPNFSGERAAIEQRLGATFSGINLSTNRDDMLGAIINGLIAEGLHNYKILAGIHPPARIIYAMGGASSLASAMHRSWPGRHVFRQLRGDSLTGLVTLARRVTE